MRFRTVEVTVKVSLLVREDTQHTQTPGSTQVILATACAAMRRWAQEQASVPEVAVSVDPVAEISIRT